MKYYLYILLAALIVMSSCRHKKEVVQIVTVNQSAAANPTTTSDSIAKANTYRFVISFYSIGAGTDIKAHREFTTYLDNYQKQNNVTISMEATPWGREGEVDYCMKLTELTAVQQQDFIANLKTALADAKWVHFAENAACRNKRK